MPPKPSLRNTGLPKAPGTQFQRPLKHRITSSNPAAQAAHSPPPPPPPFKHVSPLNSRTLRSGASIAFFSFCAAVFFRDHFFTVDTVNGSSMSPTLSPYAHETGVKDNIFIQRGILGRRDIRRGDVITFWKPHKPNEISIKRVIGIEGDTVYPHRGYACDPDVVNGARVEGWDGLGSREWALGGDGEVEVGKVVVPRGHVWVEGDNWRRSFDSCDFGPVSLGLVDGKAMCVWRDWLALRQVGDERERGRPRSRVVQRRGRAESAMDIHLDD